MISLQMREIYSFVATNDKKWNRGPVQGFWTLDPIIPYLYIVQIELRSIDIKSRHWAFRPRISRVGF